LNSPIDITQYNYDDHWQEIEVELDRVKRNLKKNFYSFFFVLFSHRELVLAFPLLVVPIHLVLAILQQL